MPEETKSIDLEQGRCVRNWHLPRVSSNGRPRTQVGPAAGFGLDLSGTTSREDEQEQEQEKEEQGKEKEQTQEGVRNSERIRVRLAGSIYLWACGETEDTGAAALKLPDVMIGWLILVLQGLAYIMLIARAKTDTDNQRDGDDSGYSMASVTGAMYLLVASTTPDLRAGFTLLVDGLRFYQQVFGGALLTLYGLMIYAAMKVLFATSNDDASVVINAVTVLFIADVDEKALLFFTTVPQKWRLFWAIYTVGISFALALVGIVYVGDSTIPLEAEDDTSTDTEADITDATADSDDQYDVFDDVPSWFVCAVNPGAVTLLSFYLSIAVLMFAEALSDAGARARKDEAVKTWRVFGQMCHDGVKSGLDSANKVMRKSPYLCVTLFVWLAHGVVSWSLLLRGSWGSTIRGCLSASNSNDSDSAGDSDDLDDDDKPVFYVALTVSIVALIAGVSMKGFPSRIANYRHPTTIAEPMHAAEMGDLPSRRTCVCLEDSYIPSLLMGWGVGYLASTLLLGGSLYKIWWSDAPLALTIIGYLVLPCCFVAVVFMMADDDFLGAKWVPLIQLTSGKLTDKRGVWYWILATAVRDILLIWVIMWGFLVPCLNNI